MMYILIKDNFVLEMLSDTWMKILDNNNILTVLAALFTIIVSIITVVGLTIKMVKFIIGFMGKKTNDKSGYITNSDLKKALKYYVATRGQDIDPCNAEEMVENRPYFSQKLVSFLMEKNFEKNRNRFYIILADSGMGKSTFLYKLYDCYGKKRFRTHDIQYIPLFSKNIFCDIDKIRDQQNTILLLDGLDENKDALKDYNNFLEKLTSVTIKFHTVIITCRTQFFSSEKDEPKNVSEFIVNTSMNEVLFEKIYISPFNEKEIEKYLKKKYNRFFQKDKIKRSKNIIYHCPKLMVRPMLLSYIDDLIENKEKKYEYTHEIYEELVSKWIKREYSDEFRQKQLYDFSEKVAEYMYFENTVYIEQEKIEELCKDYNIQLEFIEAKSRSLLNRNAMGFYKFAHKSILEYFLAKKAFNEIEFRKSIILEDNGNYEMVKLFLGEMCFNYLKKCLRMEYFISNSSSYGLNSVSLRFYQLENVKLTKRRIINFDLEGCILSNANLSFASFLKTNLQYANLSNADLSNANLSDAVLSDADLQETILEGANLTGANLKGIKLNGVHINANLMEVNLQKSNLTNVNLTEVDMRNADLSNATLINVNLTGANLIGANIEGICLRDVKLTRAKLDNAQRNYIKKNCIVSKNGSLS